MFQTFVQLWLILFNFVQFCSTKFNVSDQKTCVAKYLRVAGPTTGVAGLNPIESVNRYYLYYMKAESPIQFSVIKKLL